MNESDAMQMFDDQFEDEYGYDDLQMLKENQDDYRACFNNYCFEMGIDY